MRQNCAEGLSGVLITDVMVNLPHRLVQKSPASHCYELAIFSCEFFIGIA